MVNDPPGVPSLPPQVRSQVDSAAPDLLFLRTDVANAFGCVRRDYALRKLHEVRPDLAWSRRASLALP